MSTVISYKESDLSSSLFDMLKAVSDESYVIFTDYLRKVIADKGLNYREIAARSGGSVTHSTIHDILAGRSRNPTVSTLKGLSKGLGVPESELFDAARGASSSDSDDIEAIIRYARGLSPARQLDLLTMAKVYFAESSDPPRGEQTEPKFTAVTKTPKREMSNEVKTRTPLRKVK
jgi:transcriptional regulator with XRE-family HTH domain